MGGRRGECSNGTAGTQHGAAETGESTGEYLERETLCTEVFLICGALNLVDY